MPTPASATAAERLWRPICPDLQAKEPSPTNIIRRCADNKGHDIGKRPRCMLHLDFVNPNPLPSTLSFRIRFSGANIRGPAHCHSESALAVRNLLFRLIVSGNAACPVPSHSCDVGFPALIETDSYQGAPSGVPPRTHPAGPRPSGATATARSSALPLIALTSSVGSA